MISPIIQKVKYFLEDNARDLFIAMAIFLIGLIGFGLGRLSVIVPDKAPFIVEESSAEAMPLDSGALERRENACEQRGACTAPRTEVTASKNGSVYYFPWCSNSIKEENKILFKSEKEAEDAGYRLAKNCSK